MPPEVIFSAYSKEDYFPIEDIDFLSALAQSRDRGLLDAAAAWMEYQVWVDSVYWVNRRPEYQGQSLSIYEIDALDPVAAALADYHQAGERYLFMILDDMAAFGYLDDLP